MDTDPLDLTFRQLFERDAEERLARMAPDEAADELALRPLRQYLKDFEKRGVHVRRLVIPAALYQAQVRRMNRQLGEKPLRPDEKIQLRSAILESDHG